MTSRIDKSNPQIGAHPMNKIFNFPPIRRWILQALSFALLVPIGASSPVGASEGPSNSSHHGDFIEFANGDQLWGQLESFDQSKGLVFRRDDSPHHINVHPRDIRSFRPESLGNPLDDQEAWLLSFTNGDSISGQILEFNDSEIRISTPYAGVLTAPRPYIRAMIALFHETVFSGPVGMEGWTIGDVSLPSGEGGQWSYESGRFYADEAASIARDVDLPGMCSVKLDLMWKGRLNIALALFTDFLQPITLAEKDNEPEFGGFYSLQINDRSSTILVINQIEPIRRLGYAFTPELAYRNSAEFEIFVNKNEATFSLAIDGKLAHTWQDNRGFLGEGDGIRLVHQGDGQIRLTNLQVRTWNGALPEDEIPASDSDVDLLRIAEGAIVPRGAATDTPQSDARLRRASGVPLRGKLLNVAGAEVQFQEPQREPINVPASKTQSIIFSDKELKLLQADAKLEFVELINGERFGLELIRIDENGLYGVHPALGPLTLKKNAVKRILFNGDTEE